MTHAAFDSMTLGVLLRRSRTGDRTADNELASAVLARFETLARGMLNRYPGVRRFEETADVVQEAMIRLLRALRQVTPADTRQFFGLAAEQIRRQLLDLVKRYRRVAKIGSVDIQEPPAPADEDLDRWQAFHEAADTLPVEQREVFMLGYYHGWKQVEMAELFQVNERTIRRRWDEAYKAMKAHLKDA